MNPIISLQNIMWTPPQPDAAPLFKNLSLDISAGQSLVIEGESGSGKSTLLRCIIKLESLTQGTIKWHNKPVNASNIRAFRRHVVYVHQQPVAIAETVAENLSIARTIAASVHDDAGSTAPLAHEEQKTLMTRLGLENIALERRFDELSVGEKQRLALVRCLTPQPDVLLLDEPTASLDLKSTQLVEEALLEYLQEKPEHRALVWVSHHKEQVARINTQIIDMKTLIEEASR